MYFSKQKNKEYMQGVISSLSKLAINPDPKRRASEFDPSLIPGSLSNRLEWKDDPCRNPALPIVTVLNFYFLIYPTTTNKFGYLIKCCRKM